MTETLSASAFTNLINIVLNFNRLKDLYNIDVKEKLYVIRLVSQNYNEISSQSISIQVMCFHHKLNPETGKGK